MGTELFVCGIPRDSNNYENGKDTIEESSILFFRQTARPCIAAPLIIPFALGTGRKGKKPSNSPSPKATRWLYHFRPMAQPWLAPVGDKMAFRKNGRSF